MSRFFSREREALNTFTAPSTTDSSSTVSEDSSSSSAVPYNVTAPSVTDSWSISSWDSSSRDSQSTSDSSDTVLGTPRNSSNGYGSRDFYRYSPWPLQDASVSSSNSYQSSSSGYNAFSPLAMVGPGPSGASSGMNYQRGPLDYPRSDTTIPPPPAAAAASYQYNHIQVRQRNVITNNNYHGGGAGVGGAAGGGEGAYTEAVRQALLARQENERLRREHEDLMARFNNLEGRHQDGRS